MTRWLLTAAWLVWLIVPLRAQTPTPTPSSFLTWDQPNVVSTAEAQAYTYQYYADGATAGVAVTSVTCSGVAPTVCRAPFPAFTPGSHTITLTASNLAGTSPQSTLFTFTFVVVPSAPQNIRVGQ